MSPTTAILVAAVFSILLLVTRKVSLSGAVAGGVLALMFAFSPTPAPFAAFAVFVVLGIASSSVARRQKKRLGVLQDQEGPRTAEHALANCGPGALLVLFGLIFPDLLSADLAALMSCGSLAAVCADTCASEWGTWLGREPRSVLTGRPCPVGTDGAVSWAGSFAGLLGAAILGGAHLLVASVPLSHLPILVLAGVAGNFVDSLLGTTLQSSWGRRGGSWVNVCCAVAGAATVPVALLLIS